MSNFQRMVSLGRIVKAAKAEPAADKKPAAEAPGLKVTTDDNPVGGVHVHKLAGQLIGHTVNAVGKGWTAVPFSGPVKGGFPKHADAQQYLADQHAENIKNDALMEQAATKAGGKVKKDDPENQDGDATAASQGSTSTTASTTTASSTETNDDVEKFDDYEPSYIEKREFTTAKRKTAAKTGAALPDGSYPIENESDLHNAVQAFGRAKNPARVKAHIRSRARALGAESALPDTWGKSEDLAETVAKIEIDVERAALQLIAKDWAAFDANRTPEGARAKASYHNTMSISHSRAARGTTATPTVSAAHSKAAEAHGKAADAYSKAAEFYGGGMKSSGDDHYNDADKLATAADKKSAPLRKDDEETGDEEGDEAGSITKTSLELQVERISKDWSKFDAERGHANSGDSAKPFGAYNFSKPVHAVIHPSGKIMSWSTSRKVSEGNLDRRSNDPAWAGATIHKITKVEDLQRINL